jgi:uracil-DNA glycosylase family 4
MKENVYVDAHRSILSHDISENPNMADESPLSLGNVEHQLRQRLDSLRAAGVDYLPVTGGPLPPPAAAPAAMLPVADSSLFVEEAAPPTTTAVVPIEQRRFALKQLAEQVVGCSRCKELAATRTQTVFGVGRLDPDICFVGEAPGRDEDLQGEPFVGAAGQLLNRIIVAMGMERKDVYICNILRCRPPNNRPPQVQEAANCAEYLEKTLEVVRPRYICTLGASAARYLLKFGPAVSMGRMRKRFHDYRGTPVLCTFHPSYLLRLEEPAKTEQKREVWEDMKMLLTRMGKPIPGKG